MKASSYVFNIAIRKKLSHAELDVCFMIRTFSMRFQLRRLQVFLGTTLIKREIAIYELTAFSSICCKLISNRSLSPYESSKVFGRELHDVFLATLNTSHATHKNYVTVDPHVA